jgi:hypothetical protein
LVMDRRVGLNVFYRPASTAVRGLLAAGERLGADLGNPAAVRGSRRVRRAAIDGCPCPQCEQLEHRRVDAGPGDRRAGRVQRPHPQRGRGDLLAGDGAGEGLR